MVFNSYTFVLFLLALLFLHRLPLSWATRKFNLLLASYLFYAAWNPPFVLLLVFSTLLDWSVAHALVRTVRPRMRRALVGLSLLGNLGVLAFFKYGSFLAENTVALLGWMGRHASYEWPDIVLPVGISFYTFQTLSYTLDVYRGRLKPGRSFLDFALYVTFFPQLVAGPIVRATEFLPQAESERPPARAQTGWGLCLILLGLFQKVVLADGIFAPVVEDVYDSGAALGTFAAWTGTLAFAGQIFCDFAGYSTCAIGTALCLGFHLNTNFHFPYAAAGFSDFWRRWHISLSTWLRDYLYIPLGGNRNGTWRTYRNLLVTMLLGGLWHGASWTFVAWGALHGILLSLERVLQPLIRRITPALRGAGLPMAMLGTFAAICYTWVFFRARTFPQAYGILCAMSGFACGDANPAGALKSLAVWLVMGIMLAIHMAMRARELESVVARAPRWLLVLLLAILCASLALAPGEDRAFIYFQF
ncbi:MAG TPA: MBOAT family O-acyltransferase [Kiritimatiellia bacterium]|nr:MBOAT family O-acyltransferase [Kiritimatiellia bacterium]